MDVEQKVGCIHEGLQLPGASQLDRITRAEQHLVGPDAVEIFVHAP